MKLKEAYELVIADLDSKMENAPNRELADISNYLETVKADLSDED
jgi:hypothetical protein